MTASRFLPPVVLGCLALAGATAARAADPPAAGPAPPAVTGEAWSGLYAGVHLGYAGGHVTGGMPAPASETSFGALSGGVQLGYNLVLPSRILLGVETDMSFPNYLGADDVASAGNSARGRVSEQIDYVGSLRGRLGYVHAHWLVFVTGGLAYSNGRFIEDPGAITGGDASKILGLRAGWTAGGGIETAFDRNWTARIEYLYRQFGDTSVAFASGTHYASAMDLQTVRFALNRRFDRDDAGASTAGNAAAASSPPSVDWEIHGQTTYIQQGYPGFRSSYYGANSLTPWPQTRETWSNSAFLGVKLWEGGELYYNPELIQGFGLNATFGAAGFPNGEAQKSNFAYPHYITSRLFVRQTIGLGGDQETVDSDYGQMAGKRDISRLTLQAGKFAVHDMFDNNAYAADPRTQFQNWSIWAAGAFDYPGDMVGLTYGAVAELNQRDWALRGGYFLVVSHPNTNDFDMQLGRRGGYVGELEARYALLSRPGKLRVIVWMHDTFSGGYRDAIDLAAATPGLDPTDAIVLSRRGRVKYGYVFNLEQSITDDIGVFGRWSWNNGRNEISAFTDIDSSLSVGTSIKGTAWNRPDDIIGLAGAINGISKDHRDYLAAGGMGILIGDGRLDYREEKVLEAYYAIRILRDTTLTFDYQFMADPAYNADRGPISIFSGRVHAQF